MYSGTIERIKFIIVSPNLAAAEINFAVELINLNWDGFPEKRGKFFKVAALTIND